MTQDAFKRLLRLFGVACAIEGVAAGSCRLLSKLVLFQLVRIALDLDTTAALISVAISVQSIAALTTNVRLLTYPRTVSDRAALLGSFGAMFAAALTVATAGAVSGPVGYALLVLGMALSGVGFAFNGAFRQRAAARFPDATRDFHQRVQYWSLSTELCAGVALMGVAYWWSWPWAAVAVACVMVPVGFLAAHERKLSPQPNPRRATDLRRAWALPSVKATAFAILGIYAIGQGSAVLYAPMLARTDFPVDAALALAVAEAAVRFALLKPAERLSKLSDRRPREALRMSAAFAVAAVPFALVALAYEEHWWLVALTLVGWMSMVEMAMQPSGVSSRTGMGRVGDGENASQINAFAMSLGFSLGAMLPTLSELFDWLWRLLAAAFATPGVPEVLILAGVAVAVFVILARKPEPRPYSVTVEEQFDVVWRRKSDEEDYFEWCVGDGGWGTFAPGDEAIGELRYSELPGSERYEAFQIMSPPDEPRWARDAEASGSLEPSLTRPAPTIVVPIDDGVCALYTHKEPDAVGYQILESPDGTVVTLRLTRTSDAKVEVRFVRRRDEGDLLHPRRQQSVDRRPQPTARRRDRAGIGSTLALIAPAFLLAGLGALGLAGVAVPWLDRVASNRWAIAAGIAAGVVLAGWAAAAIHRKRHARKLATNVVALLAGGVVLAAILVAPMPALPALGTGLLALAAGLLALACARRTRDRSPDAAGT